MSPGRLRLRAVVEDAVDHESLRSIGEQIAKHHAVQEVRTSGRTGSVLVLYEGQHEPMLEALQQLGTVELDSPPPFTPMLRLKRALAESEQRLAQRTRGLVTPGTLGFIGSIAAALVQLRQGFVLPPALSMLETALKAAEHEAARELAETRRRH